MPDLILHHYWLSPYAEKVRVGFGIKQAVWKSVEIPNVMPKPDLMPLTGGYRRTPVLQVGADIYCDTQLIMLELERLLPGPALLPKGHEGEARALTMWADRLLFGPAVGVVMSQVADKFGEAFKKDRSEFSGRSFDPARMRAAQPVVTEQTYSLLTIAEAMLSDDRRFLLGDEASLPDCALYNPVWFIRQHLGAAASPLDRLPALTGWFERMTAIGHGARTDITSGDALDIAKSATPQVVTIDAEDPSGLKAGDRVTVTPDDTGKVPVTGTLVGLAPHRISLARNDPRVGDVVVHFPRAGYFIAKG